jgi:Rrf2 family protein
MLSKRAKYGLRALLALAQDHGQGRVLVGSLAAQEAIPRKFLELILLDLKRHGILHSKKGRGGGYALTRPPGDVSLGQVIRILDGPLAPLPCVSQTAYAKCEECIDEATCGIRLVMKEVRDSTARILDGTSLADVWDRVSRIPRSLTRTSGPPKTRPVPLRSLAKVTRRSRSK